MKNNANRVDRRRGLSVAEQAVLERAGFYRFHRAVRTRSGEWDRAGLLLLATVVIGGLFTSTALTLVVLPAL